MHMLQQGGRILVQLMPLHMGGRAEMRNALRRMLWRAPRTGAAGEEAAWAPSRDPSLGPHPRSAVGPLFDACLRVLTTYVDCIESLVGVPDAIRVRLAASVAAKRKLSPQVGAARRTLLPFNRRTVTICTRRAQKPAQGPYQSARGLQPPPSFAQAARTCLHAVAHSNGCVSRRPAV